MSGSSTCASPLPEPRAQAPAPAPEARPQAPASPALGVAAPRSAAAVPEFLGQLAPAMLTAGNLLRSADRSDPMAYRLRRLGHTFNVTQRPDDAVALPAGARTALQDLTDRAAWDEILDVGESAVDDFPLSLDLQRTIAQALAALGHSAARDAVHAEAAALARRLPTLLTRGDADGNTFADTKTRAWLGATALTKRPPWSVSPATPSREPPSGTTK